MLRNGFLALAWLLTPAQAIDFSFNQPYPNGKPLVSSFFGVPGTNATFDYVIVGGGTAGLALSARLAAANLSVAVIEAGGFYETDNSNLSVIPSDATFYTGSDPTNFQPLIDWGISTTLQPVRSRRRECSLSLTDAIQGSANRSLHYARGKTLGGSSARNYYLYQRPTRGSLDRWADVVGDDSCWSSKWHDPLTFTANVLQTRGRT